MYTENYNPLLISSTGTLVRSAAMSPALASRFGRFRRPSFTPQIPQILPREGSRERIFAIPPQPQVQTFRNYPSMNVIGATPAGARLNLQPLESIQYATAW